MISCGEPSGDLYAGALATELRRIDPTVTITGLGGDRLQAAGATLIDHFSGLSVTGLSEVVRILPRTYATYRRLVAHAEVTKPDVFVAIDYPDFNLSFLARALHKRGIPVVYYISPQLWAWRRGRMKTMKRIADLVLVIFPFEEAIYREAGVTVQWVGHPMIDVVETPQPRTSFLSRHGLDPTRPVIALLPGSRRNELHAILPGLVRAAVIIRDRLPDAQFIVARAPHLDADAFAPLGMLAGADLAGAPQAGLKASATGSADFQGAMKSGIAIVEGQADEVLAAADVALVASGTITVQAALHECPMVVVYRLSPLTYRLGKPFVHVDTYAMVNLVAGKKVVPELIQSDFTPQRVATEALRVLTDPAHAAQVRAALRDVKARLGGPGASRRAAEAVVEVARGSRSNGVERLE